MAQRRAKVGRVDRALRNGDVEGLRRLALEPLGLVSARLRNLAWPLLVGVDAELVPPFPVPGRYKDASQVSLDVNRSLWRIPPGIRMAERQRLRERLERLVNAVLVQQPDLNYYQGFHDIGAVVMLNTNDQAALAVMVHMSRCHLRDHMRPSMKFTLAYLDLIPALLAHLDPVLGSFINRSQVEGHFALSWVLTWFGHVLDDLPTLSRIFDACLASHPLFPLYLSVAIVIGARDQVLAAPCEYSAVYQTLTRLPAAPTVDYDAMVVTATDFMTVVPPERLTTLPTSGATRALLAERLMPAAYAQLLLDRKDPKGAATRWLAAMHHRRTDDQPLASLFPKLLAGPRRDALLYVLGTIAWAASMVFANDVAASFA